CLKLGLQISGDDSLIGAYRQLPTFGLVCDLSAHGLHSLLECRDGLKSPKKCTLVRYLKASLGEEVVDGYHQAARDDCSNGEIATNKHKLAQPQTSTPVCNPHGAFPPNFD